MHTIIVIGVGFAILGICALAGALFGGRAAVGTGAIVFVPIWLVGAAINMYIGVRQAGYSVADEAPIFLIVFAGPAAVALAIWWKLR